MNRILDALKEPALITYILGDNNYSWLCFRNGQKLLVSKTLYYFEKRLPDFIRVHKTAMVNPTYVKGFTAPPRTKMQGKIHLSNGITLPVGRRRWSQLKGLIMAVSQGATVDQSEKTAQPTTLQRIYLVITDQIKASLVAQTLEDQWSQWQLHVFDTETGLLKSLSASDDTELPAMILLHAGQEAISSTAALRLIKNNDRFRLIPTLLLTELQNYDQAQLGYSLGANSVILQSVNLTCFVQRLEKVFRFWLSTASAPSAMARLTKGSLPMVV
jgi:DNA-binding NarL/FixJ family response regulator